MRTPPRPPSPRSRTPRSGPDTAAAGERPPLPHRPPLPNPRVPAPPLPLTVLLHPLPLLPSPTRRPMTSSASSTRLPRRPPRAAPPPSRRPHWWPTPRVRPISSRSPRGEQALLGDRLRADPPSAAELLHSSFTEVGASGRRFDREEILAHLAPLGDVEAEEFIADEIAPGRCCCSTRLTSRAAPCTEAPCGCRRRGAGCCATTRGRRSAATEQVPSPVVRGLRGPPPRAEDRATG